MFEEEQLYFHRLEKGVWELYSIPSQDEYDDDIEEINRVSIEGAQQEEEL